MREPCHHCNSRDCDDSGCGSGIIRCSECRRATPAHMVSSPSLASPYHKRHAPTDDGWFCLPNQNKRGTMGAAKRSRKRSLFILGLTVPRVLVLIATIPPRRHSCERLLSELLLQSRQPDGVVLCMDGYSEDMPEPACPLPIVVRSRSRQLSGAGNRWSVVPYLPPEDIVINLDDDCFTRRAAPDLIRALVAGVEECGAAAAFGRTLDGKRAPPGKHSRGYLVYAGGCGLAMRAGLLDGLHVFAAGIREKAGFDPLGIHGDDDALLSAFFHVRGIKIRHAATGVINAAAGTGASSQTREKLARGEDLSAQKKAIAALTGWPWLERR